jgi:hypothetical protein
VGIRLALIVDEVRFTEDSVKPDENLRKKVEGLRGQPMTDKKFMDLLTGITAAPPMGARGVRITLERMTDDAGCALSIQLIANCKPKPGLAPQLEYGTELLVGEMSLGSGICSLAGIGKEVKLSAIDWRDLRKDLKTAFSAIPSKYLYIDVHCAERR